MFWNERVSHGIGRPPPAPGTGEAVKALGSGVWTR